MRSAFLSENDSREICFGLSGDVGDNISIKLNNDNLPYSKWDSSIIEKCDQDGFAKIVHVDESELESKWGDSNWMNRKVPFERKASPEIQQVSVLVKLDKGKMLLMNVRGQLSNAEEGEIALDVTHYNELLKFSENSNKNQKLIAHIKEFIVFSPENSALRIFQREGQIEPLGINGEGLLKLLSVLSQEDNGETLKEIKSSLQVLGWFEDFKLVDGDTFSPSRIAIKDRYIEDETRWFDQMSANEGFLFLLFYFALFSTKLTPSIFAIDNIDASLNPALCEKLLSELVRLAKKHDKQVLLTTHNPATLDGLNLDDDEQRLFVVSRGRSGETRVRRIQKKASPSENQRPVRLSEMFLRGSLGGIPKGF
jgi:hypothetical protein